MDLLIDNIQIIYYFLPMPDKRNLIRVNKKCNTLSYLISDSKKEFFKSMVSYNAIDKYEFVMENLTILEEITMEFLYYGYPSIMPRQYINNNNKILRQKYLYFHTSVIGNKELIHILIRISNIEIGSLIKGLAYPGKLKLLKANFILDMYCCIDNMVAGRSSVDKFQ